MINSLPENHIILKFLQKAIKIPFKLHAKIINNKLVPKITMAGIKKIPQRGGLD